MKGWTLTLVGTGYTYGLLVLLGEDYLHLAVRREGSEKSPLCLFQALLASVYRLEVTRFESRPDADDGWQCIQAVFF